MSDFVVHVIIYIQWNGKIIFNSNKTKLHSRKVLQIRKLKNLMFVLYIKYNLQKKTVNYET